MAYGTKAAFEPLREVAFGSVNATYTALGGAFTDHVREIRIVNALNTAAYLSTDGTTDHIKMAPSSEYVIDLSTNKVRDDGLFLALGTQLYLKYDTAPSSGSFWVETLYAQGGV